VKGIFGLCHENTSHVSNQKMIKTLGKGILKNKLKDEKNERSLRKNKLRKKSLKKGKLIKKYII